VPDVPPALLHGGPGPAQARARLASTPAASGERLILCQMHRPIPAVVHHHVSIAADVDVALLGGVNLPAEQLGLSRIS
jgi:hypothetical protein